ncbi:MAG TPA: ATP-binding protein [Armatimonadota bacterium]|nr:ATP-binding protein [Armatimonadota bacterium]
MARTRSYPLKSQPLNSTEALITRIFMWVSHCPQSAKALALALVAVVVLLDYRSSTGRQAEYLYFLPMALVAASFARLPALLLTGACFLLHLGAVMTRNGHAGNLPASPYVGEPLFLACLLLLLSVIRALQHSLVWGNQQRRLLDGIRVVSTAITSSLDRQKVLQEVLDQAKRIARVGPVGIWLVDRQQEALILAATSAHSPQQRIRADAAWIPLASDHVLARSIEREAIYVSERTGCEEEMAQFCASGADGFIAIPLIARNAPLGVLAASFNKPLDKNTPLVLRELAKDAAIAIDNAQLYAEAKRHVHTLESMHAQAAANERRASFLAEAGQLFSATLDLRATMETVVTKATEVLGDSCFIGMMIPGKDSARIAALHERNALRHGIRSLQSYLDEHPIRSGEGIIGCTLAEGVPSLAHGDLDAPGELGEYARELGIYALLTVPLRTRDGITGVLVSAYYNQKQRPTEEDLQLALFLADRAAIAIENAELFEETQQARVALEAWSQELEQRVEQKTRELREAQRDLLRAERLASIGQLSATVAHELRNPLNVIGIARYALANFAVSERQQRHLDAIERQENAASRLIDTLLDFARDAPPQFAPMDLNALIHQTLADMHLPERIQVREELDGHVPSILADRVQIGQVLANLVNNAVHAMPGAGELLVISCMREERIGVTVQDTGSGIEKAVQARIFEPLFTTKTKGTGLGLAIARRIVEAHHGEIRVASTPGRGAAFTFSLPLKTTPVCGAAKGEGFFS